MALGPDNLHLIPVFTLETSDFIRNHLIEEVSVGRMRVYLMVIGSWSRCLRNPMEVLIQRFDPSPMEGGENLNDLTDIGHRKLTTPTITLTANGFPCWVKRVPGSTSNLSWKKVHLISCCFASSRILMSRRSSSTSYSMLAYSSFAFHSLRRSTTPAGRVRRDVCVVTYKGMFNSFSERYGGLG